ncbi:ribosome-associated translation inhibitor RaiA [Candidatus Dependentiae bacterium]|nr:ribosome-associated translation inhibitor RaiA [Candidatus Dependentiae bacterium]
MKRKITFQSMDHSEPIERHANEKLNKIEEMLKDSEWKTPMFMELWLKANKQHVHHKAELHLKTPQFDLNTHYENADMYFAIDNTIDKMVKLLKKEKALLKDKEQKPETKKKAFADDKYTLS